MLGTKQNYQDIDPDFKNIQSSKLILLSGHTAKPPTLGIFSIRCTCVPLCLWYSSGEYMQRKKSKIK